MEIKLKDAKRLIGEKPGRPKMNAEKRKDKRYTVRLDDKLSKKVEKISSELKVTPSELIRKMIDEYNLNA